MDRIYRNFSGKIRNLCKVSTELSDSGDSITHRRGNSHSNFNIHAQNMELDLNFDEEDLATPQRRTEASSEDEAYAAKQCPPKASLK